MGPWHLVGATMDDTLAWKMSGLLIRSFSRCCVCVWNIWTDVKLLFGLQFHFSRGRQGHCMAVANEAPCSWLGYHGWSPWRTCESFIFWMATGLAKNRPDDSIWLYVWLPQSGFGIYGDYLVMVMFGILFIYSSLGRLRERIGVVLFYI